MDVTPSALEVFVAEHVPEGLGHIVEAIHDAGQSPAEIAMEHVHEANALQAQEIAALMHGDVDAGVAFAAQAEAALQGGVDALHGGEHHE